MSGLPTRPKQRGKWGPWIKTARQLGLVGPKSKFDRKKYHEFMKKYTETLNPGLFESRFLNYTDPDFYIYSYEYL